MMTSNETTTVASSPAPSDTSPPAAPMPIIKPMRWPYPIIWIIPLAAAALAGYYVYEHHKETGVEIDITFKDLAGVIEGQTTVNLHGVAIGKIERVKVSPDHSHAIAHVRLGSEDEFLTRHNTIFWLVRPELSLGAVSGLNTLVSGPYIDVLPGTGPKTTIFEGLDRAPIIAQPGMKIVLHADQLGQLTVESPVMFRGIQVGLVQDIRLSDEADAANVTIYVWQPYTPLVRTNTQFWALKGADFKGGLFSGIQLKLDSLRALLTGGVTFNTPEKNPGPPAAPGSQYVLADQAKDEWMRWKPKFRMSLSPGAPSSQAPNPNAANDAMPTLKRD